VNAIKPGGQGRSQVGRVVCRCTMWEAMVSITQLLSLQFWRVPGGGPVPGPAAAVGGAVADDVLLWHLDEDGWD
jgi:hypothetical protein